MINKYKPNYDALSDFHDLMKRILQGCGDYDKILKRGSRSCEEMREYEKFYRLLEYFKERKAETILNDLLLQFQNFIETEGRYAVRKFADGKIIENYTVSILNNALTDAIEYFNKPSECHKSVTVEDIYLKKTLLSL